MRLHGRLVQRTSSALIERLAGDGRLQTGHDVVVCGLNDYIAQQAPVAGFFRLDSIFAHALDARIDRVEQGNESLVAAD